MDMIRILESRHLEMLKCYYNEQMDVFVFSCAGKKITIQYASPEQIASVFRKAHVADEHTEPRSARGKTYLEMVAAIIDGSDHENWIYSSDIDTFFNACEELRQSRIGKIASNHESLNFIQKKSYVRNESTRGMSIKDFEDYVVGDSEIKTRINVINQTQSKKQAVMWLVSLAKQNHKHEPAGDISFARAEKIVNKVLAR
jgi:hypothetical protein